jgi:hypothetical protein
VVAAMINKPKLLQRKKLAQRALDKIMGFVETFIIDAPEKPSNVISFYPKYQPPSLDELPLAAEPSNRPSESENYEYKDEI